MIYTRHSIEPFNIASKRTFVSLIHVINKNKIQIKPVNLQKTLKLFTQIMQNSHIGSRYR